MSSREIERLSPRDRAILMDVVRTFILEGAPVSSRSVARHQRHGVSAATIRNTMADLEEEGFLLQPHASAGRIPTAAGYHFYIDSLQAGEEPPAADREYIEGHLAEAIEQGEDIVAATGHLLSELSHQVGVVLTPDMGGTVLRAIEFMPLSRSRLLCVLVSTSGFIDQKVVRTDAVLPRSELVRISNYLTENFAGLTLRQIRRRLLRKMTEERAEVDELLSSAISLARRALEADGGQDLLVEGTASLLEQPELNSVERVRSLLDMFDEKARMVSLLSRVIEGRGVRVLIGDDSDLTSELDFSLVATNYSVGGRPLGSLGVFGPSRMPYQRMIPLVRYLGETLGQALEQAYAGDRGRR
jgi:heat-inducible transcriptional repressor